MKNYVAVRTYKELTMKKSYLISVFLTIALLISCEKYDFEDSIVAKSGSSYLEYFVSEAEALRIASVLTFYDEEGGPVSKTPSNVTEIPDDNDIAAYYIINYREGGFIFLSADTRVEPVFAYSDIEVFDVSLDLYPNGLVEWLVSFKDLVQETRKIGEEPPQYLSYMWDPCVIDQSITSPAHFVSDNCFFDCEDTITEKSALTQTT